MSQLEQAFETRGRAGLREVMETARPELAGVRRWIRVRQGRYTRTLVHRDPRFEVLLLAWAPGACSPIHDHDGQKCWMLALAGRVETMNYRRVRGGRHPGPAVIEPVGYPRVLETGQLDNPTGNGALHQVRLADGETWALTLHVYAAPIDQCLVYNPRQNRCERRKLNYDFVGPSRRAEPPPDFPVRESFWMTASRTAREVLEKAQVGENQAQLSVQSLRHTYTGEGEVEALRDVNLNIRSGDFVCLLGPSGCGKSTILHALAGHIAPSGGSVSIDRKAITGPGPDRLLMFQDAALFPWMSAEQNITFVLGARGIPRSERKERASAWLRQVQLGGFERALPHQLSGGMKMRLSLARALAVDAPVLLMDEPFGSLDAQTRLQMNELLHRLWRERGKTIVFVTHDVNEAVFLGSRVVLMAPRPGRIVADLDLNLPLDRDPDDVQLMTLAAEIRRRLREATEADAPQQEGYAQEGYSDEATGQDRDVPGVPAGADRRLGDRGKSGDLAALPLPRPPRRR